ncbi:MAG: hypothetical protein WAL61_10115 [Acidimicrobiales bacterium]
MPTGTAALPWWADALLILVAAVIVITLVVLVVEMIRNIGAGRKHHQSPTHDTEDLNSPVA